MQQVETTRVLTSPDHYLIKLDCGDSIGVVRRRRRQRGRIVAYEAWRRGACVGRRKTFGGAERLLIKLDDGM